MRIRLVLFGSVIAVACIAGIVMWTHTGSGIALANVLAQVQQIAAYMFQETVTFSGTGPASQDEFENMEGTTLISQDDGMKMETDWVDPNSGRRSRHEMYVLLKEKTTISLMHDQKLYVRMEFDDTLIEKIRQNNYDPTSMLKQILNCKYESLGRSVVDGVEVEGFQTTDPNCLDGMTGWEDIKIWADVKTQLPVRLEMDGETDYARMHVVVHNFQWNYPVAADMFKVVIPADYEAMPGGPMKMPAMNEEGAIAGLKLCAELIGRYPEELDSTTFTSLMTKLEDKDDPPLGPSAEADDKEFLALKQLVEEYKKLSPEERDSRIQEQLKKINEQAKKVEEQAKKRDEQFKKRQDRFDETMNKLMPIHSTAMFFERLAEEKKDPAYYGNVVTPQDADKVLLRWKLSDNQYRVIFGGLHTETVDAQTLAELEKDLPK